MASFFQSFRNSLMPKQLLRFALKRFDILDPKDLDLDNLDFTLGRNNVFEFRDVGLILENLEKRLQLPPSFSIQRAKVLVLRLTLPLDLYASPAIVEVDGIDIKLKVSPQEEKNQQQGGKRKKATDDDDIIPTAADLAQSFLETQPSAEKRQLEQALRAAEAQDVEGSQIPSESEDDDDLAYGTGQALSLPAFLTDFFQGIVDRVQIRVRGITLQVDAEVPVDPSTPTPELVTLQLTVENVDVEGVTALTQELHDDPRNMSKPGKRHILLDNIRAVLMSEANVFSSLVRSPSMPSSAASQSPVVSEAPAFPTLHGSGGLDMSISSDPMIDSDVLAQSHYPLRDSEDAFNIPYDLSSNEDEAEVEGEPASPLSTPRASIHQDISPPSLQHHAKSELVEPEPTSWVDAEPQSQSEPYLRRPMSSSAPRIPSPGASVGSLSASTLSVDQMPEDLAESHLYSHEDAESMYMSAFSQTESVRLRNTMPGSWDMEEPSNQPSPPPKARPEAPVSPITRPVPGRESPNVEIGRGGDRTANPQWSTEDELPGSPLIRPVEVEDADEERFQDPQVPEPEPPQEDIPTPRGPTRLVKEILSLDSISVFLPSTHKHIEIISPDLGRSISPQVPGAFSIHSAAPMSPELRPAQEFPPQETPDTSIEVIVRPLEIRFDASIGFVLAMIVSRLLEAVRGSSSEAAEPTPSKPGASAKTDTPHKTPDIKVTLEQLSVNFLEKLAGVADTPERIFGSRGADFTSDILLRACLTNLKASLINAGPQTETNLTVEKFRFGYPNDDIISFDRQVQMFESVASTFPLAGEDITVKVKSSADSTRAEINTLPLYVKLDLQRLDETFSWFGGLSSFLNMGSSVTSNATKSPKIPPKTPPRSRGVRFEAPISPDDHSLTRESKTDLRINGLRVDVVGKDCSVLLNTSALKLVHREEGIGVHFSRIRLAGPYIRNSRAEPSVVAEVVDTRFEYVLLPRDKDLERLLELITPSKVKFDENEDEIMVDTLLRQRRKGPVLSLVVGRVRVEAGNISQLSVLPGLVDDLAKLGTVAKYLPEDDRPGLLTLGQIKNVDCTVDFGGRFGSINAVLKDLELAQITIPSLFAVAVGTISVNRNRIEELVATETSSAVGVQKPPVLMMRMIDDMEPVLKVKLLGLSVEYRVPTIMDVLGLAQDATPQDFEDSLAASVANLGEHAHAAISGIPAVSPSSPDPSKGSKPIKFDLSLRDCLIGLNPLGLTSKLLVVLTDTHLEVTPGKHETVNAVANLKKASVLLIDDVSLLDEDGGQFATTRQAQLAPSKQITELCSQGYVNVCQISAAKIKATVVKDVDGEHVDVEVRDDLLVLETCADSTQTLISLANALKPPTPPSKEIKYRTSVVPVQDLLASITADAFGKAEGDYNFDDDFAIAQELGGDTESEEDFYGDADSPLQLDSQYYQHGTVVEELFDATSSSLMVGNTRVEDTRDGVLLSTMSIGARSSGDELLLVEDDFFKPATNIEGTAHRWNSKKNRYDESNDLKVQRSPLRVCVRDVHVIWNLFDGYDWARTREIITKAVQDVEAKAYERRARIDRRVYEQEIEDEETVIGDFLFNSIYIGIPANKDPRELAQAINQQLADNATETESIATTAYTNTTIRAAGQHRSRSKKLKLNRSKRHKITFELKGVNADLVTFPPDSGETLSSVDVRVHELDVFDHVPTSTWKKFAMYDHDAGERELGAHMVHMEILTTKPVQEMPASEIVLKVEVLPLRLHVDQDALDFITRFFEFKDDTVPTHVSPSDIPFVQRAEVMDIPIKLDFKPHRVDYAGLRSGHTTEFMNFLILEDATLTLRHIILYGVSGFDKLGKQLNDIWTDNVKRTQLPGILAGIAPVRSLVNAGTGFRELIEIPIREYRKDGRIVRSIGKGAAAFAKTTGTEVVKLGAKLAIGTQYALQGAEGLLVQNPHGEGSSSSMGYEEWEEPDTDEEKKQISLYADQPLGIIQGMRGAYASLARDLSVARDAIIAVPAEVMESTNAQGAAVAVLKRAPTIIFRPAIGATKAIGQTLLGATNSLDPHNRRRVEAKYKKY
ncbi:hypothetical protein OQA88_13621 [Cercophora sp. LCS_1]